MHQKNKLRNQSREMTGTVDEPTLSWICVCDVGQPAKIFRPPPTEVLIPSLHAKVTRTPLQGGQKNNTFRSVSKSAKKTIDFVVKFEFQGNRQNRNFSTTL